MTAAELVATFLEQVDGWGLRKIVDRTEIPKATLSDWRAKRKSGGRPAAYQENAAKIIKFLRSRGAWPRDEDVRADPDGHPVREGRAAAAIEHFTSKAIARALGNDPARIRDALYAFAEEKGFTPREAAELGEFVSTNLRIAQKEET